ncbi:hypothetical protein CANMA_004886 [Candida margitis]|uniref:uncharacterized protein n=1 Tax=Candida margitis TaxID=1775924 RepID=UPI002228001F|nr:uncharacterized protein CANMA_004886 [Candida margitis]KAI5954047.1 hypothetical protein CANMA_004886 [Candida margitis]
MPHPGRPKGRMNKKTQAAQQAMQQEALARQQAAQIQAAQARRTAQEQQSRHDSSIIKEEAGIQLHDEADLITYRNDALIRYMSNHENIENVMAKPIHSSKIIPPSLYPTIPKRNADDYSKVNLEEIYYGDLEYMKYFDEQLAKSLSIMHQEDDPGFVKYLFNTANYPYRRAKFSELEALQQKLHDKASVEKLETEYKTIIEECKEKFHHEYKFQSNTRVYAIPLEKLAPNVDVKRAPDGYNPKDSDPVEPQLPQESVAGFENKTNEEPPIDNSNFNSNDIDLNLDDNSNDMFQFVNEDNDNFDNISSAIVNENKIGSGAQSEAIAVKSQVEDNSNTQIPQESMSTGSNLNDENIRSGTNALTNEEPPQSQQSPEGQPMEQDDDHLNNAMVAEINDLFNDNDHDMDHSAIVNDDIEDLYNFDQGDNGDLLGGSEFEQDFLSQINQSME